MNAPNPRTEGARPEALRLILGWGLFVVLASCLAAMGCGKDKRGRVHHRKMDMAIALKGDAKDGGETYKKILEHPFLPAGILPFSTFSVDVDTAAYSNVRRYLNDGEKPPKDAVRIEELINYFTYDYPNPEGSHPLGLQVEMAACPWNPKHLIARVGLQAKKVDPSDRPPMNLVFLVDTSGSMGGENRLPLLKQGLSLLAEKLRPQDRVAIVAYAGSAGVVLPSTPGDQTGRILAALNRLDAGGSTAGGEGIELAYTLCADHFIKGGVNRVLLGTDGDFNVGITREEDLVKLIQAQRKTGIYLTVLGFGMGNLKDRTMESLAEHGNGHYAYVDTLEEARRVMVDNIAHLQPVARDVKIQVEFNKGLVQYYRLIGYDNRLLSKEDFEDDAKDAGDMGAGQQVTAIYEIIPQEGAERVDDKTWGDTLMKVAVRYHLPEGKASILLERPLERNDQPLAKASTDFRFAAAVAAFGMALRETPERGTANFDLAEELARGALGLDPGGYRGEFLALIDRARKAR